MKRIITTLLMMLLMVSMTTTVFALDHRSTVSEVLSALPEPAYQTFEMSMTSQGMRVNTYDTWLGTQPGVTGIFDMILGVPETQGAGCDPQSSWCTGGGDNELVIQHICELENGKQTYCALFCTTDPTTHIITCTRKCKCFPYWTD